MVQTREYTGNNDGRRVRIQEIPARRELGRIGYPTQEKRAIATALCQINRELRERSTAADEGLHDLRAARKECHIDILQRLWRDDLCNLDIAGELLQQSGVFFRLQQNQPAERKAAL